MTPNLFDPTPDEIDLPRRVTRLEGDMITFAEHGTLDLSDRDDNLGRLDRQLTKEAKRASEDRMWEAFNATCPIGTVADYMLPLAAAWEVGNDHSD